MIHLFDEGAITKVVYVACILHNFCIMEDDEVERYIEGGQNEHPNAYPPLYRDNDAGEQLRNRLVQNLAAHL